MGRLVTLKMLENNDLGASWYLNNDRDRLPNEQYAHRIAIDYQDLNPHKVAIREWIENNLSSVVILTQRDLMYYYQYGKSWEGGYQISHGYFMFFFTTEQEAMAFSLRFSDIITAVPTRYKEGHIPRRDVWQMNSDGEEYRVEIQEQQTLADFDDHGNRH